MPSLSPIDHFLYGMLLQYDEHVYLSGAYNKHVQYPQPSLANDVLPMFELDRWATGPGQRHTKDIFPIIRPALQLASRFLMDDWCLSWWTHLTYGERCIDSAGPYIKANPYSDTVEATRKVKSKFKKVGKVITFMFEPEGYEIGAYGSTTASKKDREFFNDFRTKHWPPIRSSDKVGHARPCVVMQRNFLRFFRDRHASASQDEVYRVWLLFAITLVHEMAHAYNFWLTPAGKEPRWRSKDKEAELGWSWERHIIGYGLGEYRRRSDEKGRFRQLYQIKIEEYHSPGQRSAAFQKLAGSNRTDSLFTKCDARGYKATPPLMNGNDFSHSETWFETPGRAKQFFAAIQTVPMKWVVYWFQEAEWKHRSAYCAEKGFYVRPSLGNAFTVLYERNGNKAATLRPLNPAVAVDAAIIKRRGQGLPDY